MGENLLSMCNALNLILNLFLGLRICPLCVISTELLEQKCSRKFVVVNFSKLRTMLRVTVAKGIFSYKLNTSTLLV